VEPNSYFYDLNAKVTYRPSSKDVFSLSFFNGQDNLDNSQLADQNRFGGNFDFTFNRETIDLTDWGNWGSSLKWSHRWNDQWYTNANISYSNYYSQRDRSISINIERNDSTINRNTGTYEYNDLRDFTLRLDNEWKLSQNSQFDFGLQATFQDIQYDFTQNDTLTVLDRQNTGWTTSLYAQYKHTIRDKWILQGGLRSTYYTPSDGVYLEPRASFTYLFSDRWKGKAAWGTYYQFATRIVREDIQQGSRDFWLLADNQQVPIGSATHYIAGLSYETPDYLLDVEGYYKSLSGLSEYTTRLATQGMGPNRTLSYEELFYQGTGTAKGIEFLAQKKTGRLNGWIGYTLGRVVYDFPAFGENPFPANQDQTHELKIVGSYNLNRWTFGANFIYATGRPYTAPVGYYQLTLVDGETADFFEISDKNALRFDDYHRFDISATYAFDLFGGPATLGLSIYNLYNRQNTWYKEFDVVEGELLETDVSLLDMTPSLFFTWSLR
jgi:ferric enterobactin receptor